MQESIAQATASCRRVFGSDMSISVARCPAWGHDDICLIVRGKNHAAAAVGFMQSLPGATVKTETSRGFMGLAPYTYSVITAPRQA